MNLNLEKIMQDTAVERGFPFNDCVVRGEEEAYYQVQRKLHDSGIKAAWVMFSRFQGETRLMLVEGGYSRRNPLSLDMGWKGVKSLIRCAKVMNLFLAVKAFHSKTFNFFSSRLGKALLRPKHSVSAAISLGIGTI